MNRQPLHWEPDEETEQRIRRPRRLPQGHRNWRDLTAASEDLTAENSPRRADALDEHRRYARTATTAPTTTYGGKAA